MCNCITRWPLRADALCVSKRSRTAVLGEDYTVVQWSTFHQFYIIPSVLHPRLVLQGFPEWRGFRGCLSTRDLLEVSQDSYTGAGFPTHDKMIHLIIGRADIHSIKPFLHVYGNLVFHKCYEGTHHYCQRGFTMMKNSKVCGSTAKQRDFPLPVGKLTNTPFPFTKNKITSRCFSLRLR